MWKGIIATGYNSDGYGDYDNVTFYHIESDETSNVDETLERLREVARVYCSGLIEEGYDMPYDWTWGDILGGLDIDIPEEIFASVGIKITDAEAASIVLANDEIVVMEDDVR